MYIYLHIFIYINIHIQYIETKFIQIYAFSFSHWFFIAAAYINRQIKSHIYSFSVPFK